jgi:hypothetical protein
MDILKYNNYIGCEEDDNKDEYLLNIDIIYPLKLKKGKRDYNELIGKRNELKKFGDCLLLEKKSNQKIMINN